MRLYQLKPAQSVGRGIPAETIPGSTLTEVIDLFLAQGVTPDLLPADLGEDADDEFDNEGYPYVDPLGNIRTDLMELRERRLVSAADDLFNKAYKGSNLDLNGNPPLSSSEPLAAPVSGSDGDSASSLPPADSSAVE